MSTETNSRNLDTSANNRDSLDNTRTGSGSSQYKSLGPSQYESLDPSQYESLDPSQYKSLNPSQYESLEPTRDSSEPYEGLQQAVNRTNEKMIDKKSYYNTSDMKSTGRNTDDVSSEGNAQAVIYSNLKLASE